MPILQIRTERFRFAQSYVTDRWENLALLEPSLVCLSAFACVSMVVTHS